MKKEDTRVERDADAPEWTKKKDEDDPAARILVPWDRLSATALTSVIEEFVTREGTEYGAHDVPLHTKVAQVRRQLEKGEVVVVFDAKTETVSLAPKRDLPPDGG